MLSVWNVREETRIDHRGGLRVRIVLTGNIFMNCMDCTGLGLGLGLRLRLGSCMMRLHEGVVSPIAAEPFYLLGTFVQLLVQQLSHTQDECEVSVLQNA